MYKTYASGGYRQTLKIHLPMSIESRGANPSEISLRSAEGSRPQFTVITAVHNGARTIERAIASVAAQTYRGFEYIVIDGASTDGTVQKIRENSGSIAYWISEPDSGVYSAWNKALRCARGRWISFLGADDEYLPDALEIYADAIATHPDAQFISSRVQLVRNGAVLGTIGKPWSWPSFARYMTVAHVGSLHRRSLFEEVGFFNETYRICGDYELLLRLRSALQGEFVDRVTARMASGGISSSKVCIALSETQRAKTEAGGRSKLLCIIEKGEAYLRSSWRYLRGGKYRM